MSAEIKRLESLIVNLGKRVSALEARTQHAAKKRGPVPKGQKLTLVEMMEQVEESLSDLLRPAFASEEIGGFEEHDLLSAAEVAKIAGVVYSADTMGRILKGLDYLQVTKRMGQKSVRLYRVVREEVLPKNHL